MLNLAISRPMKNMEKTYFCLFLHFSYILASTLNKYRFSHLYILLTLSHFMITISNLLSIPEAMQWYILWTALTDTLRYMHTNEEHNYWFRTKSCRISVNLALTYWNTGEDRKWIVTLISKICYKIENSGSELDTDRFLEN